MWQLCLPRQSFSVQLVPVPSYPGLQAQVKLPTVSVQVAFTWQLCAPELHSLTFSQLVVQNQRIRACTRTENCQVCPYKLHSCGNCEFCCCIHRSSRKMRMQRCLKQSILMGNCKSNLTGRWAEMTVPEHMNTRSFLGYLYKSHSRDSRACRCCTRRC